MTTDTRGRVAQALCSFRAAKAVRVGLRQRLLAAALLVPILLALPAATHAPSIQTRKAAS